MKSLTLLLVLMAAGFSSPSESVVERNRGKPQDKTVPKNVEAHIRKLKDGNAQVRRRAAIALGRVGVPAVPALLQAMKDEDPEVRIHAMQAWNYFPRNFNGTAQAKEAVLAVIQSMIIGLYIAGEPIVLPFHSRWLGTILLSAAVS